MRARFDLYCKLVPLRPFAVGADLGVLRGACTDRADILVVRENVAGLYFGQWGHTGHGEGRAAYHHFEYRADQVRRILGAAHALARRRRQRLTMVVKRSGTPAISELWASVLGEVARDDGVNVEQCEIDNAVYQLINDPRRFDVVVTPNMFGDVLADCGASAALGTREMGERIAAALERRLSAAAAG